MIKFIEQLELMLRLELKLAYQGFRQFITSCLDHTESRIELVGTK
jgi:hypothetical protein